MSIKEQMEFAKEELTQDEKLLAGLIKAERFYKRNRKAIIGVAALAVVGGLLYGLTDYLEQQRLLRANAAFLALEQNPSDTKALETLRKENPKLAALVEVREAVAAGDTATLNRLAGDADPVVADLAAYHAAAYEKSPEALRGYRMQSDRLLKDFALFNEAYLLMAAGKVKEGRERLAKIPEDSPLAAAAEMLGHYGVAATAKGR